VALHLSKRTQWVLTLVTSFVGSGKFVTTTGTAGGQYALSIGCAHAFTETVAISTLGIRWLISTLGHVNSIF
jgi:hypothetical protein